MAKKIDAYIKLQIPAGKANPSPPVGPALGQRGVNIMGFCKEFNAATQHLEPGMPIPVIISVYSDRSFTFQLKTPPASVLLRKTTGVVDVNYLDIRDSNVASAFFSNITSTDSGNNTGWNFTAPAVVQSNLMQFF